MFMCKLEKNGSTDLGFYGSSSIQFCWLPGAVWKWHSRGVAGHGHGRHGTDGGSAGHHIWRRGVDNLRSTWGQCYFCDQGSLASCYINRWQPANTGTCLHKMGIQQVVFLKIETSQERKNSTTGFAGKKNWFWPILEATTCSASNSNERPSHPND